MFEYTVIVGMMENLDCFIDSVNAALSNNWECQGGVCVSVNTDVTGVEWLYQAMIRKVKPE